MFRRHVKLYVSAALASVMLVCMLLSGLITVNVWHQYGGWGFSAGSGCTGLGYIQQPPGAPETDSGWFTDLCE